MTLQAHELPALTTRVDLSGQVAVVTGAGRGIGLGIAEGLTAQGASVVIADVDADAAGEAAETLPRTTAATVDVTDADSVSGLVEHTLADHQRVDILINNAAIATTKITEETTEAEWRKVLDVNLTGPFLCSQAVLPHMTGRGSGRIVNIASVAAKRISFNAGASYTAAKAGLLAFTRHLGYEVAGRGVTVNAICPGPTLTPMMAEVATEETLRAREKSVPRGRLALPEDIMRGVLFLVSDLADMVCGQALDVDGGALLGWYDTETYFERRGAAIASG